MNDDVKKSLIDLIRKVNEKGIKNDAVIYKLVEIEELLYYKIQNDDYDSISIEMLIAVKALIAGAEI